MRILLHGTRAVALAAGLAAAWPGAARAAELHEGGLPTLERMIGEMLMLGFAGARAHEPGVARAVRQIGRGQIGGVVLMDRNIASPREVGEITGRFIAAAGPLPPLIAVDQEGGSVQRLSSRKGFRPYPTAMRLAQRRGPLAAYYVYRRMADELRAAGFNLNFGPVVDLNLNARNQVINGRGRSYGADPERVTDYAEAFISAHRAAGVLTAIKHFPGHGSSVADSHHAFVDLTRSWSERELMPYRRLAASRGIDTVMVGHLYHPDFSSERTPATLSASAIDRLRSDLAFDGVVITDDLGMGAVRRQHGLEESLVRAVAAGNDVLLLCNPARADLPEAAIRAIARAVADGRIPAGRIVASYRRIVALKIALAARDAPPETALSAD